jgi:hypothetical protein
MCAYKRREAWQLFCVLEFSKIPQIPFKRLKKIKAKPSFPFFEIAPIRTVPQPHPQHPKLGRNTQPHRYDEHCSGCPKNPATHQDSQHSNKYIHVLLFVTDTCFIDLMKNNGSDVCQKQKYVQV